MKIKGFTLRLSVFLAANTLFSLSAAAQTLPLFEQPDATAKVVGSADLSAGIIPIFTPANNKEWMKIADPRNGNVGWIKTNEISKGTSSVTFTQKIISSDEGPKGYHVMQFGTPMQVQPLDKSQSREQLNALIKRIEIEQQSLQNSFQSIVKDMNDFFQYQVKKWNELNTPAKADAPVKPEAPAKTGTASPNARP